MTVSAVLLSGGESRRMGRDKATLDFRGEPLWSRQLQLLRQIAPTEILISARSDPAWRPADTIFIPDQSPSRGPLSGIAAALDAMRGTHLLVLAVDMPLMNCSVLRSMSENIGSARGVIPKIQSRAEPLGAIYPSECLPRLRAALANDNFAMQPLIDELVGDGLLVAFQVSESDVGFYRSVNNPIDLETISREDSFSSNAQSAATANV